MTASVRKTTRRRSGPAPTKQDNNYMSDAQRNPTWLTPQLIIQVLTIVITLATAWAAISNRLTSLQEKLVAIESRLPSREVIELKMNALERQVAELKAQLETQDAWVRNTRERLAERGWKP